jgi:hypothetical protein
MLPAGAATEAAIGELSRLLATGDTIIDGGNTFWKDDIRRAGELKAKGLHYLDVGTSGGVWGLERGYCLMIGGEKAIVGRLDPIFAALAPGKGDIPATAHRGGRDARAEQGYLHAGPNGAGHFVKMIHNGIEYGMMQAMAEGFDILRNAGSPRVPEELRLAIDVADVAEVWRRGSVITSWLLDLTAAALAEDPALAGYSGHVGTPAKAAGPCRRRSRRLCRPRCSPLRSTRASAPARTTPSPRRCCPPCARASAATWSRSKAADRQGLPGCPRQLALVACNSIISQGSEAPCPRHRNRRSSSC